MDAGRPRSLQQATILLDQMDSSLARLLTLSTLENTSHPQDANLKPNIDKIGLQESTAQFAQAVGQLESMLLEVYKEQPTNSYTQLQQEVESLENTLTAKKQLLERCQERIKTWHQQCDNLADLHQKNLFIFGG